MDVQRRKTLKALQIFVGSENDKPLLEEGLAFLNTWGIGYDVTVASVHRGPVAAMGMLRPVAENADVQVIIGGACSATGLPGMIAGIVAELQTNALVLGVGFSKNQNPGIIGDATFALSPMPRGVPLAYCGNNNTGFLHAYMMAVRVIRPK